MWFGVAATLSVQVTLTAVCASSAQFTRTMGRVGSGRASTASAPATGPTSKAASAPAASRTAMLVGPIHDTVSLNGGVDTPSTGRPFTVVPGTANRQYFVPRRTAVKVYAASFRSSGDPLTPRHTPARSRNWQRRPAAARPETPRGKPSPPACTPPSG